ncbi:hypothetical protein ACQEV9_18175 [Streptomyces chartreusis]|uniref:hypothetical protein n=1 Tax=Streptomyces chartreusis TaxID=1969 RepID=UPI003D93B3CE
MSAPTTIEWLRTAADRVSTGSGRLIARTAGRLLRWAGTRLARLPWWAQLGLAYAALLRGPGLLARLGDRLHDKVASGAWSGLLTVSTVLWVAAAYRAGGRPEPSQDEPEPSPDLEAPQDATAPGPPPVSPTALVAAVRDVGTPHAQLKPLAEHLQVTTDAVRAAAAAMGWPVKDVRMQGRSASAGLRWDEAPTPPLTDHSPSVVGAGQDADDNDDDTEGEGPREGFRVEHIGIGGRLVHDPTDVIRHHKTSSPTQQRRDRQR